MSKNILVTGGAGYIGSHTVLQLLLGGYKVVVADNLDNSSTVAIKRVEELAGESGRNLSFRQVDLRDRSALKKFFAEIKYCEESICSFLCLFLWLLMDVKILCFHRLLLFMVGRRRFHVQKSPPGCSESIWTNKDSCKMTIDIVESLLPSLDRGGRAFVMGLENKLQENDKDEMSGEGERKRKRKATKGEGKSTKKGCRTDDAGEPSEPELRGNEKPVRVLFIIEKKSHPQVLKILRDKVTHRRKIGAGLGVSLFPGLSPLSVGGGGGGGFGLFGYELLEFEQVQQQLTQNPNMMREIMNTPAIQSLMNNPELMRSLIMSNPQMREIIDRNPELGHILNDPSILRQTLEAARNPELMREMMRNTDRAMSNIEASPEGFNMLRRMYENVQEPFLNATTMGGNTGNNPGSNPFAALLGNQGGSQARNSTDNTSSTNSETAQGQTAPNTNPLPNPWSNTVGGGGTQTNATARPNPAADARTPGVGGLGGLGLPDLPPMLNGMPDSSQLTQLLQNPAISQMMQSVMSNPQYMNQIMNLNPQLRSMFDSNPQLREMMQNPEVVRQMFSPETMQQMLALQQSLMSLNRQQPTQDSTQTGGTTAAPGTTPNLDLLMNMFGGLGTGGLGVPNQPDVPPEELYATQLSQLQEMGFYDTQENIRALRATAGNVHAAVERLLGNPGQ